MATAYNLQAQLSLRAPTNTDSIKRQIESKLRNIKTGLDIDRNSQRSIDRITDSFRKARDAGVLAFRNIGKESKAVNTQLDKTNKSIENIGANLSKALRRFGAFTVSTSILFDLIRGFEQNVKASLEFEREINKISQVTGTSVQGLGSLRGEVDKLSTSLGVSSNELLSAARTLSQAGLSAKETKESLRALALSDLAPTFDNIGQTTEGAIAVFRQFGKEAKDLEGILGSINAVSANFAVESGDLIAAIRRTGGAIESSGGNLNELFGLFTSIRATTRESAESIATGLRTISTRLQRVSTQKFLANFGIQLRLTREEAEKLGRTEGEFVGLYEAVRRLSISLNEIPSTDPRFAQITEQLGGFRQITKVIPLIKQNALAQEAYNTSLRGTTSLVEDADKAQETLINRLDKLAEKFELVTRNIISNTTFKVFANTFIEMADSVLDLTNSLKGLIPILTTIGTFRAIRGFPAFARGFKGDFVGRNSGGVIPGTGNKDTVPALLTPQEYVIKQSSAKRLGRSTLDYLNKKGELPKFASGGPVGGGFGSRIQSLATPGNLAVAGFVGFNFLNQDIIETSEGFKDLTKIAAQTAATFILFNQFGAGAGGSKGKLEGLTSELAELNKTGAALSAAPKTEFKRDEATISDLRKVIKRESRNVFKLNNQIDQTSRIDTLARQDPFVKPGVIGQNLRNQSSLVDERNRALRVKQKAAIRLGRLTANPQELAIGANKKLIAAKEAEIASATKVARRAEVLSLSFNALAAASVALGGYITSLSENALKNAEGRTLANFERSRIKEGFTGGGVLAGAGTGAAIGAAIGSFFPVIGTAIGAAAGGVIGGVSGGILGSRAGINQLDRFDINTSIGRLTEVLEKVTNDNLSGASGSGTVRNQISVLSNKARTVTDSSVREDLQGGINGIKVPLRNFINDVASTSSSLKEFTSIVGADTIEFFTDITNTPISEFNKGIVDSIKQTQESLKVNKRLISSQLEFLQRGSLQRNLVSSIKDLDVSIVKIANEFSVLEGEIGAFSFSGTSLLGRASTTKNVGQFESEVTKITSIVGAFGNNLKSDALGISTALRELPQALTSVADSGAFEGAGDFGIKFEKELNKLNGVPQFVKDRFLSIADNLIGSEGTDQDLVNKIKGDLSGVIAEFEKQSQPILSPLIEFSETFANQFNVISGILQKRIELEQNVVNAQLSTISNLETFEKTISKIDDRDINFNRLRGLDIQRQQTILGGNADAVNNPQEIFNRLVNAQQNLENAELKLQNATNLTAEDMLALRNETVSQKIQVNDLTRSLEFLSDATSRSAAAQDELSLEQNRRNQKFGVVNSLVFGGREEKQNLIDGVKLTNLAIESGLQGFSEEQIRLIDSTLTKFNNADVFSGKTGEDIRKELIGQTLGNLGITNLKGITTPSDKEDRLRAEIKESFDVANQALLALEQKAVDSNDVFLTNLDNLFQTFITDLNTSLTNSINNDLNNTLKDTIRNRNNISNDINRAREIENVTGTDLRTALNNAESLQDVGSKITQIDKYFNEFLPRRFNFSKSSQDPSSITPSQLTEDLNRLENRLSDSLGENRAKSVLSNIRLNSLQNISRNGNNFSRDSVISELTKSFNSLSEDLRKERESLVQTNESLISNFGNANPLDDINTRDNILNNIDLIRSFNKEVGQGFSIPKAESELQSLNEKMRMLNQNINRNPRGFASGGLVGGQGNRDSIPSRLMPGEFVLNRQAVEKVGLSNLNRVNNAAGNTSTNSSSSVTVTNGQNQNMQMMINPQSMRELNRIFQVFGNNISRIEQAFNSFPKEIQMTGKHQVEIIINGAQVMTNIMPEVKNLLEAEIKNSLNSMLADKFPDKGQII